MVLGDGEMKSKDSGKAHIVVALSLIGVCLIGMVKFMADGKYAVAVIWCPCVLIIGIFGLVQGIQIYRGKHKEGEGHEKD
jgi:hypothetical protein